MAKKRKKARKKRKRAGPRFFLLALTPTMGKRVRAMMRKARKAKKG